MKGRYDLYALGNAGRSTGALQDVHLDANNLPVSFCSADSALNARLFTIRQYTNDT